jgi:hypothetical protein
VAPPEEFVVGATPAHHRWVCQRAQGKSPAYTSQESSPRPCCAPNRDWEGKREDRGREDDDGSTWDAA